MNIKYIDIEIVCWLISHSNFTHNDLYSFILTLGYDNNKSLEITSHILGNVLIRRYGKYYSLLL